MDVHCCTCGEPWDQHHLRHDVSPEEAETDGWQFGRSRLVVLQCPCCPKDGSGLPDAKERASVVQDLADILGDDEDGLASTLEEWGY